jgi:phosphate ABC transporter permease protein PstC
MEAGTIAPAGERRSTLHRSPAARLPDRALTWGLTALSLGVIVLIAYFFLRLVIESKPVFQQVGVVHFLFSADWVPSKQLYGALPLLAGTLICSAIALLVGIPVAVAFALFVTELAPRRLRGPLTILIDLLAAVPSVVYGLWGFFFLVPKLQPAERWLADALSFVPFVGGTVTGPNYFVAGLILAIMILPIASAISREVISTVPSEHKEAALALGATRWETIRMAVLPYARGGIAGGAMLGLGRAIGETIAVTLVIGNAPVIGHSIFQQGYTLAAVIANEFGEAASDPLHRAALIAAGLVLFVLTLVVNAIARGFILRAERGRRPVTSSAGDPLAVGGGRSPGSAGMAA